MASSLSFYLCLNVIILLSCTGASDLPDSTEEGKDGIVTHDGSVFLPPSVKHQHEPGDDAKGEPETLLDSPSSVVYINMNEHQEKLKKLQDEIKKEQNDLEDIKSQYKKNREMFDSRKVQEDKYLAKMDETKAKKAGLEEELRMLKESLAKKVKALDVEDEEVKKVEKKIEDFESRKKTIEKIKEELKELSNTRDELEKGVMDEIGNCTEIPEVLRDSWADKYKPEMRLCIKT